MIFILDWSVDHCLDWFLDFLNFPLLSKTIDSQFTHIESKGTRNYSHLQSKLENSTFFFVFKRSNQTNKSIFQIVADLFIGETCQLIIAVADCFIYVVMSIKQKESQRAF